MKWEKENWKNDKTLTARCSAMVDSVNGFILDCIFAPREIKETTLAMQHIRKIKELIGNKKAIVIYDGGYNLIELILTHKMLGIPFIICGKKSVFPSFQKKIRETCDKTFTCSLSNKQVREFHNQEI